MHPNNINAYNIDNYCVQFLILLLVLEATGLGIMGFQVTFLRKIEIPGTPSLTLYFTTLLQETSNSDPLVSDEVSES